MEALEQLRSKTIQLLQEAQHQGLITPEERAWRLEHVQKAQTVDELEQLVQDVMSLPSTADSLSYSTSVGASLMTILSSRNMTRRDLAHRVSLVCIMGTTELDYRQFDFSQNPYLDVVVVMGEVTVLMPPQVRIVSQIVPVLGEFQQNNPPVDALHTAQMVINGVVMMGSLKIVRPLMAGG